MTRREIEVWAGTSGNDLSNMIATAELIHVSKMPWRTRDTAVLLMRLLEQAKMELERLERTLPEAVS